MRKALFLGVATLAVASAPSQAADILFTSSGNTASSQSVAEGGVAQIRMDSGAVVSIVGPAEFSLDGEEITLANGGVTVAGAEGSGVVLRLPGGAEATVTGSGSLAVRDGQLSGNVMGGTMQVTTGTATRTYRPGQNWAAAVGSSSSRVVANAAQPSPNGSTRRSPFATTRQTIAQAAMNGLAVTLGEGLAGVGASGDVVAAARGVEAYLANPAVARLPSGDVARLLAYSDRLAAALGGGASFEGASPLLVNAYLQYLANNGQIGEFQSAYASLVSQYLTLLANGGFASDYTGADLSQLNSYIDYLQLTGQLGRIGAAQQNLLSAYLGYLRSGGVPSEFVAPASLLSEDAIAAYVAAVQAYASFVLSGGVPSEFGGLNAQALQAYLEALSSRGLFDTLLTGQAQFLRAYLTFLQNGGNIDEFEQLPPPPEFPTPAGTLASNQFMALRGSKTELAPFNGQIDRSRANVVYDEATGAPLFFNFGTTRAAIGEAELIEAGRISDGGVAWGRWVNGTAYAQANTELDLGANGIHVIAGPMATNMPATGLIEYDFVGGTNPTLTGGEAGSLSVAKAAISFGSTTRVGAELKTDFADRSYTLQTIGGIAQTAQNGIALREDLAPGFFFGEVLQTTGGLIEVIGTGAACQGSGGCTGEIRGYISGDEAAELAISYIAKDAGGAEVLGTAGFAKGDPLSSGGGSSGGGNYEVGPNFDLTRVSAIVAVPGTSGANTVLHLTSSISGPAARRADGGFTEISDNTVSTVNDVFSLGTATLISQFGNDDAIITRYGEGTLTSATTERTIAPGQSAFVVAVSDPALFLPTAGSATYQLIESSPVVALDGSLSEGTFTAELAVDFGISPKFAMEGSLTMDSVYTFSTTGGLDAVATSGVQISRPGLFGVAPLTGEGAVCPAGATCSLRLFGQLTDDFRTIASTFYTLSGNMGTDVFGAAIFGSTDLAGLETGVDAGVASGSLTAPFADDIGMLSYVDTGGANRKQAAVTSIAYLPIVTDSRGLVRAYGVTVNDQIDYIRRGNLAVADLAGDANWQVGRFNGGSIESDTGSFGSLYGPDSGFGYALIPVIENLPASGRIDYTLLGATQPTYQDGRSAPGTFAGQMAVTLGSSPMLGLEATVTMSDASYAFATEGGVAAPSVIGSSVGNFYGNAPVTMTGSGAACASSATCGATFSSRLGGDGGTYASLAYLVRDTSTDLPLIGGAAAFGGTYDPGEVVPPPTGTEETDQIVIYSSSTVGIDSREDSRVTYDTTTGAPLAYVWELNSSTTEDERPTIGNNTQHDSGSVAGVIGWTRWAGGTTGGRFYADQDGIELPANGGWHVVAGDPATNLPTSGTVQYALIGSTAPTIRDGSLAPGSFSGELAVAFGSTPKVGVEFDVAIGGNSYAINTPGGVADPMAGGMALDTGNMRFFTEYNQPVLAQGSGPACAGSGDCRATINGFLAGDGGTYAGVVYTFGNTTFDKQIDGSAVFGVSVP
ncbi:MAG: hypothetical protein B7Y88_06150 [Sphingomonadales bacterium 32-64-17]|nr:MAG: hypothetical protein B7Y88_06150 [Sphingomonadales bacterium 32-64-17]